MIRRAALSTLICAGVMGAAAWAALSAGWVQNAGGAVVVAVAATVEAALLARAAVPRHIGIALAPLLALAAIVPTTLAAMPFDGDPHLGHVVGRYASALFSGLASTSNWPFIVGLCGLLWLLGFWVGWMAMRERRGVLAVLPVFAVLASIVLNTKFLDAVAPAVALAVLLSLLLIADSHFDLLQARWSNRGVAALPGTRIRFAASVAVVSVLLTVVALVIPPVSSADISGRFFPGSGGAATKSTDSAAPTGAARIQFSAATEPGGALVSQPRPVFSYQTDVATPLYVPLVVDTNFASGNWFPDSPADAADGVSWGGLGFSSGILPRDLTAGDGAALQSVVRVRAHFTITADGGVAGQYSPLIGDPIAVSRAGIAYGEDYNSNGLLTVEAVTSNTPLTSGATFDVVGDISVATTAQLRGAGRDYPAFVQRDMQFGDDGSGEAAVVARLARQWTRGATNPYDDAVAIEKHLRDPAEFSYTLSPKLPPVGEWPLAYFLTTSHAGYCQYFASAMGAMLRSLGVPARLVNGFGPGTTSSSGPGEVRPVPGQPAPTGKQRIAAVTTSDAHTWVQAFFPGYGWIPFEPTPPSDTGVYQPFKRGKDALSGGSNNATGPQDPRSGLLPGFQDTPVATGAAVAGHGTPNALLGLAAAAAALLLLALVLLVWLSLPGSVTGAWRRLEVIGAIAGVPRRGWETHREYAARFARSAPSAARAIAELATLLGRMQFSREGIDGRARRSAPHHWRSVLRALPGLMWRMRRRPARAL